MDFQRFLETLEKNGRKQTIHDRDGLRPYLERWYVAFPDSKQRDIQEIPFNTFVHQFMLSDEPVFHSHPWDWYHSTMLEGGFWEHTPWGITWHEAGASRYVDCLKMRHLDDDPSRPLVPANLHWVEIPAPGKSWTLFTRGPKIRTGFWGFMPDMETGEVIYHETYLEMMRKNKNDSSVSGKMGE